MEFLSSILNGKGKDFAKAFFPFGPTYVDKVSRQGPCVENIVESS